MNDINIKVEFWLAILLWGVRLSSSGCTIAPQVFTGKDKIRSFQENAVKSFPKYLMEKKVSLLFTDRI